MSKQIINNAIDSKKDLILNINDRIWEYAETAFKEFKSTELFVKSLKDEGFEVETNVADISTAFLGRYGSGKPVIGILAEYDALSGISQMPGSAVKAPFENGTAGHGCGHNCLGAAAFAAALGVKDYLQQTGKSGTVILYGCPGEEGGSGKAFMAREGVFDECDIAITWHPGSTNNVVSGSSNANYQVSYKFLGVSSHAAGDPHLGRSALDAVELMNVGVQFLREHMIDAARVHYAITNTGGYSPNVVQPIAEVLYLIRSPKVAQVDELYHRVNDIAKGVALMTGTKLESTFIKACSNLIPNTVLEKVLDKNLHEFELPTYTDEEKAFAQSIIDTYENKGNPLDKIANLYGRDLAEKVAAYFDPPRPLNDFIMPHASSEVPMAGSTDVSDVSWVCPTAQINVVTTASGTPGHSWQFTSCNKTTIAHKGVLYAGKVMAGACIDVIENPQIAEEAKVEHNKRLGGGKYVCPIPAGVKPQAIGAKN